jgi:LacI family transcriptional regulator
MNVLLDLDQPPTAVFACNDLMAMGAICAASKRRLRIPEDIAIIGCDDIALAAYTNPSLTTVAVPKHEMGSAAVEMLVARMEDAEKPAEKRILPVELVIRDSC